MSNVEYLIERRGTQLMVGPMPVSADDYLSDIENCELMERIDDGPALIEWHRHIPTGRVHVYLACAFTGGYLLTQVSPDVRVEIPSNDGSPTDLDCLGSLRSA